jgi:acetyl-CoA hydrolase
MHRQLPVTTRSPRLSKKTTPKPRQKRSKQPPKTQSKRTFGKSRLERCDFQPYDDRIMSASDAVEQFLIPTDGIPLVCGFSGFTGVNTPKAIPKAIVEHVDKNQLAGKIKYDVFVGASTGPDIDNAFAERHLIHRRMPFCAGKTIQNAMNTGQLHFIDQHLSTFGDRLLSGQYHANAASPRLRRGDEYQVDVAVIEVTEINSEGDIIPGISVGLAAELAHTADKIILELNTLRPSIKGLHDITQFRPIGRRHPYPLRVSEDRIGDPFICINPSRVVGVIQTSSHDYYSTPNPPDEKSSAIAGHLIEFLEHEIAWGRLPKEHIHLQSGVGSISDKVVGGLSTSNIHNVRCYTEVLQDSFIPLIKEGRIRHASTTGIKLSEEYTNDFYDNLDFFKQKILVRNQTLSNSPEILSRIGLVAMNTPVEVSIFGNINSSHVGSKIISGLGGSNDMARSSLLSIMHCPSTRPTKTDPYGISSIVPQVTNTDSTARDVQVIVTDQGLADLRGLSPIQRAREIIDKTAHPLYKDQLTAYLDAAIFYNTKNNSLDTPNLFKNCYDFHINLEENGTMRLDSDWLR